MHDYLTITAFPSTRDFLQHVSRCVVRMDEANATIMAGVDGVQPQGRTGGGSSGYSSPVEAAAIFNLTTARRAIRRAEAIRDECADVIGTALVLCEGIRGGVGDGYGDAVELHYIDRMSTAAAAEELGVSPSTVKRWCAIACDWCDAVGARKVMECAASGAYDGMTLT